MMIRVDSTEQSSQFIALPGRDHDNRALNDALHDIGAELGVRERRRCEINFENTGLIRRNWSRRADWYCVSEVDLN
jgi:hypothetical protein